MDIKEIGIYQEAEKCYPQRWPVDLEHTYKRDGFIESAKWGLSQLSKWIPVSERLPSLRVAVRLHAVRRRRSCHVCIQESHFL